MQKGLFVQRIFTKCKWRFVYKLCFTVKFHETSAIWLLDIGMYLDDIEMVVVTECI